MFHHIGCGSLGTVNPRLTGQTNAGISNLFPAENNHDISSLYIFQAVPVPYYGFGSEYNWDPDPDYMGSVGPDSGEPKSHNASPPPSPHPPKEKKGTEELDVLSGTIEASASLEILHIYVPASGSRCIIFG
jgi:hypothetical protein